MKQIFIFVGGILVGFVIVYSLCVNDAMPIDCCAVEFVEPSDSLPPGQGDSINSNDALALINTYQSAFITPANSNIHGVYGGRIGVEALMLLLADTRNTGDYVNFRFGFKDVPDDGTLSADGETLPNPDQIYLIMSKGSLQGANNGLIIRNSSDAASFCPPTCGD